jgi:hypothetical protein
MAPTFKFAMCLLCQLVLTSCAVGHVYGSAEIEKHLESLIGRKYDPSIGWGEGWNKKHENETNIELEYTRKSGCSYSIRIRKDSNTVDGWNFTSPRSLCEGNYSPGA